MHHDWGLPVGVGGRVALGAEHWGTRSDRSGTVLSPPRRVDPAVYVYRYLDVPSATMVVGQAAQRTTATMVVGQAVAGIGGAAL